MKSQKTTLPKSVVRTWFEVDASSQPLGRIATRIANALRGKHKRGFTPHMDMGDFVVATNVDKLKFTGRKLDQKLYFRHSGYLGGLKSKKLKDENVRNPEFVLRHAVTEMLDDVKFRKKLMSRLKVVKGTEHTYAIVKKLI
jgi:large subunit ribosomal protein L13